MPMLLRYVVPALLGWAVALACEDVAAKSRGTPPAEGSPVVRFQGACDASGAVALDERRMLVVDDEDNLLRIYDVERGGPPSAVLSPNWGSAYPRAEAEADLEAVTRLGPHVYFLASHGRTKKGRRDPNRLLFFATRVPAPGARSGEIELVGSPYRGLLEDLARDERLAEFRLADAALMGPKEHGGLNLEGMIADPDGRGLWLGFRNPMPRGRALLVRLENPEELLEGRAARFSDPHLLDLGGLGVRGLGVWRGAMLVIAGPTGDGGPFQLFLVSGSALPEPLQGIDFGGLAPEGLFTAERRGKILLLSDDGTRRGSGGKACKKLKDRSSKGFRGLWLSLGASTQVVRGWNRE